MKLPVFGIKLRGFTLIELLIVIAIISILISVGLASFRRAQMQARDRQRQADLSNIAGALEQFYGDNNSYPLDLDALRTNPTTTTPYIRVIPTDPSTTADYTYIGGGTQAYCVVTGLETVAPADANDTCPINNINYGFIVSSQD